MFINNDFSNCDKKQSSNYVITRYLDSYKGWLIDDEISNIEKFAKKMKKPTVVVLGGEDLESKLDFISTYINQVDYILLGGAIGLAFLKNEGYDIGKFYIYPEYLDKVSDIIKKNKNYKDKIIIPEDYSIIENIKVPAVHQKLNVETSKLDEDYYVVDIGTKTIKNFKSIIENAKTIIWNGPMGIYEIPEFSNGTRQILKAIKDSKAKKMAGGKSTTSAIAKFSDIEYFDYVSTGGKTMLSVLQDSELEALSVL